MNIVLLEEKLGLGSGWFTLKAWSINIIDNLRETPGPEKYIQKEILAFYGFVYCLGKLD